MNTSQLAKYAQVPNDTVRYYTRIGMLNPGKNPENGYHCYGDEELKRLRFAIRAKRLGFSLDDIRKIMTIADDGDSPCDQVRELLTRRIGDVERHLKESLAMYARMRAAMGEWRYRPNGIPDHHSICSLIEHSDEAELHINLDALIVMPVNGEQSPSSTTGAHQHDL